MSALISVVAALGLLSAQAATPAPIAEEPAYQLDEIVVEGVRLEELTRRFVDEVAAPARGRGPARWAKPVCIGMANLKPEVAQPIIDRIATVADDIGLRVSGPGCQPNVLIMVTNDGPGLAAAMVAENRMLFRPGATGMDLGPRALARFMESDRPVRWWHVSSPTNRDTGQLAVRLPSHNSMALVDGNADSVFSYAPMTRVQPTLLNQSLRDDMRAVYVVVDADEVADVPAEALADYLAMIAFAQIDAEADTGAYDSVLNLFEGSAPPAAMTGWDRAYLEGLYSSESHRAHSGSQVQAISNSILNVYRRGLNAEE